MHNNEAGDRLAGLSKRLLVLFVAMVIAGFVLPSPGIAARPGEYPPNYQVIKPTAPELLIVPQIRLRAPVVPIEVDPDGVLHPPSDVHEVGWWKRSARPGSASGQTLITGHTVHTGGGVMNELGKLRPGALVEVQTKNALVDYRATKIFVYTKAQLAEHAHELFGQKRKKNRLVLVTCTGWTGSEYTSNIIVFAEPIGIRKPGSPPLGPDDEL